MVPDAAPYIYPPYHARCDTPGQIDTAGLVRVATGMERMVADPAVNGLKPTLPELLTYPGHRR